MAECARCSGCGKVCVLQGVCGNGFVFVAVCAATDLCVCNNGCVCVAVGAPSLPAADCVRQSVSGSGCVWQVACITKCEHVALADCVNGIGCCILCVRDSLFAAACVQRNGCSSVCATVCVWVCAAVCMRLCLRAAVAVVACVVVCDFVL